MASRPLSMRRLGQRIGHVDREIPGWYFHLADQHSQEEMRRLPEAAAHNQQSYETEFPVSTFFGRKR